MMSWATLSSIIVRSFAPEPPRSPSLIGGEGARGPALSEVVRVRCILFIEHGNYSLVIFFSNSAKKIIPETPLPKLICLSYSIY